MGHSGALQRTPATPLFHAAGDPENGNRAVTVALGAVRGNRDLNRPEMQKSRGVTRLWTAGKLERAMKFELTTPTLASETLRRSSNRLHYAKVRLRVTGYPSFQNSCGSWVMNRNGWNQSGVKCREAETR